jgi:hypothetical protein
MPKADEKRCGNAGCQGRFDLLPDCRSKTMYIRLLFALLGYVLKGCFVNAMGMGRTLQPVHLRQSARQTGGSGGTTFHFLVAVEKLLERFRVLARIATVCAARRDHVVDSTSVWFPYGQTCLNTSVACYSRGGSPHYRLVLRRHLIPSRGN